MTSNLKVLFGDTTFVLGKITRDSYSPHPIFKKMLNLLKIKGIDFGDDNKLYVQTLNMKTDGN